MSGADTITVATIDKSDRAQLRVLITTWRGQHKLELAEFTPGPVPNTWWRSKQFVSLPIDRLDELRTALDAAEEALAGYGLPETRGEAA